MKMDTKQLTKGLSFFRQIGSWFVESWRRFRIGIANYLKSKTRNFPTVHPKSRRKVVEEISKGAVFRDAVAQFARETGFATEEVEEKGERYLKEIASDLNYLTFPFWDVILTWVFKKIYDGLVIDKESLKKLTKRVGEAPIVFVPNHRSHVDYLILSYVAYYEGLPMLYICAGKNMNFWPFGPLFRKSGGFFIRRSFEGNRLYQAALYAYLHYLLKEKALMEFFIEGTRSRTGKLLAPRLGILSLLARAFQEQTDVQDILFVPTSIVYESVIEERTYSEESEGASKKSESIWDVFRIRKYLHGRYGKVYLRFGEPISITEIPLPETKEEKANYVPRLANQIGYAINRHTVVTPSSLVAMSLLTHPHPVILEEELQQRASRFMEYLEYKQAPVSELVEEHRQEALHAALQEYARTRLIRRYDDEEEIFYRISFKRRRRLEFYKNMGFHFFISAAAVAQIILSHKQEPISRERIEDELVFLRELFADEFRFSSRKTLSEHVQAVLDFYTEKKALTLQAVGNYQVGEAAIYLTEYAALLASTLSLYWGVFQVLTRLPKKSYPESELTKLLVAKVRLKLLRQRSSYPEALSPFAIRNTLNTATRYQILEMSKTSDARRVRRRFRPLDNQAKLKELSSKLERYLG